MGGLEENALNFLNLLQVGVACVAPDGKFLFFNKAFSNLFEYSAEKLIKISFLELSNAEDFVSSQLLDASLLSGEREKYVTSKRFVRNGGVEFKALLTASLHRDSQRNADFFIYAIQDLAAVKVSDSQARVSQPDYEQILDNLPVAVWAALGADAGKVRCNQTVLETLKLNETQLAEQGRSKDQAASAISFRREGHEISAEDLPWAQAAREKISIKEIELEVVLADNSVKHFFGGASPLRDAAGNVCGSVAAFQDITAYKRASTAMEFVAKVGAELAVLSDLQSAAQKVASVAVPFLADFCTVDVLEEDGVFRRRGLAHILLEKERLLRDLAGSNSSIDVSQLLGMHVGGSKGQLITQGEEALKILGPANLQQLIRREFHPRCCLRMPVSLNGNITAVISLFRAGLGPDYVDEDLSLAWDLAWKTSVALENARLCMRLQIESSNCEQRLHEFVDKLQGPLLEIIDRSKRVNDMPGSNRVAILANEMLSNLQEMRKSLHLNPETSQKERLEDRVEKQEIESVKSPSPLRILVADDNLDLAQMTATMLRQHSHETQVVSEGGAAIKALATGQIDVALLDIGLPGLDGYEVARRLRAGGITDTLFIAVTGYGQERDRQRSEEAGFDHHLVKPLDYNTLEPLILLWQKSERFSSLISSRQKEDSALSSTIEKPNIDLTAQPSRHWADC